MSVHVDQKAAKAWESWMLESTGFPPLEIIDFFLKSVTCHHLSWVIEKGKGKSLVVPEADFPFIRLISTLYL